MAMKAAVLCIHSQPSNVLLPCVAFPSVPHTPCLLHIVYICCPPHHLQHISWMPGVRRRSAGHCNDLFIPCLLPPEWSHTHMHLPGFSVQPPNSARPSKFAAMAFHLHVSSASPYYWSACYMWFGYTPIAQSCLQCEVSIQPLSSKSTHDATAGCMLIPRWIL